MGHPDRRAARPSVETFESRELLSSMPAVLGASQAPRVSAAAVLTQRLQQEGWAIVGTAPASRPRADVTAAAAIDTGGTNLPPSSTLRDNQSPLFGDGVPTFHEQARQNFRAGFRGTSFVGPGRFSNQAAIHVYHGSGGSTSFLHGNLNMAIAAPVDPGANFVGEAVLSDRSTLGGTLGLVLVGNPADVDALGRPTRLTFSADPAVSSDAFAASAAEGTVSIHYGRNGRPTNVIFDGRLYTSGLTNPLFNPTQNTLTQQSPRPVHRATAIGRRG